MFSVVNRKMFPSINRKMFSVENRKMFPSENRKMFSVENRKMFPSPVSALGGQGPSLSTTANPLSTKWFDILGPVLEFHDGPTVM